MDLGLSGTVALVVGGSGLVGRAVAQSLLDEGAVVVLAARDQEKLSRVATELGGAVSTVVMDTRDAASVTAVIDSIVAEHGSIGVVVNTAAPSARTLDPAKDREPEQVLDAIDGKPMGYLRVANAVIPHMTAAGFGRIINISGQNAFATGSVTGSIRNAAAIILTKNLADGLIGTGVTANVVNPAIVTDEPTPDIAVGRGGDSTPAQVAALVTYLASSFGAAISGESIAVGHRSRGVTAL